MTGTGNSFHAGSSSCHTLSIVLAGEAISQQFMSTCFLQVTDLDNVQARAAIEYPVYHRRSDVQHVVLNYLVERCRLAGL